MNTVIETPTFQKQVDKIWSEEERLEFISWISSNTESGDVIKGTNGARKVRWSGSSRGKRGGVRVIYFNISESGVLYLITIYKKSAKANISPEEIKRAI
jgi:mRNA-degrading endonuclease RelE of RelBE toxin-antitoxin system